MNKHFSLHIGYYFTILIFLTILGKSTPAEELLFEPANPCVVVGKTIQLSVSGIINNILWRVVSENISGTIEGSPTKPRVTYKAPNEIGEYQVLVIGKNNTGKIKSDTLWITVLSQTEANQRPECQITSPPKAAILIHASNLEEHVISMGTHAYKTLKARFYEDEEIYITPLNMTLENSFEQAKTQSNTATFKGLTEEPLVIIFIGDSPPENLSKLVDDYQKNTGNKVVVIIDAPYSGILIDALKGNNRVIVTSTNDTEYNNIGEYAFSKFYFDQLHTGVNYWAAWKFVTNIYAHSNDPKFKQQQPQLEDTLNGELARQLCLNDCFYGLPGPVLTIRLKGNSAEPTIELGGHRAIMPKQITNFLAEIDVHDAQSVEILVESSYSPTLSIPFFFTKDDGEWQPSYNPLFSMDTTYIVTAKVTRNNGEIVATSPVSFFVITQPHLIGNRLYIPAVAVGNTYYQVELFKRSDSRFELDLALVNDLLSAENIDDSVKTVSFINNHVLMESLIIDDGSTVNAKLELLNDPQNPWLFKLTY